MMKTMLGLVSAGVIGDSAASETPRRMSVNDLMVTISDGSEIVSAPFDLVSMERKIDG